MGGGGGPAPQRPGYPPQQGYPPMQGGQNRGNYPQQGGHGFHQAGAYDNRGGNPQGKFYFREFCFKRKSFTL